MPRVSSAEVSQRSSKRHRIRAIVPCSTIIVVLLLGLSLAIEETEFGLGGESARSREIIKKFPQWSGRMKKDAAAAAAAAAPGKRKGAEQSLMVMQPRVLDRAGPADGSSKVGSDDNGPALNAFLENVLKARKELKWIDRAVQRVNPLDDWKGGNGRPSKPSVNAGWKLESKDPDYGGGMREKRAFDRVPGKNKYSQQNDRKAPRRIYLDSEMKHKREIAPGDIYDVDPPRERFSLADGARDRWIEAPVSGEHSSNGPVYEKEAVDDQPLRDWLGNEDASSRDWSNSDKSPKHEKDNAQPRSDHYEKLGEGRAKQQTFSDKMKPSSSQFQERDLREVTNSYSARRAKNPAELGKSKNAGELYAEKEEPSLESLKKVILQLRNSLMETDQRERENAAMAEEVPRERGNEGHVEEISGKKESQGRGERERLTSLLVYGKKYGGEFIGESAADQLSPRSDWWRDADSPNETLDFKSQEDDSREREAEDIEPEIHRIKRTKYENGYDEKENLNKFYRTKLGPSHRDQYPEEESRKNLSPSKSSNGRVDESVIVEETEPVVMVSSPGAFNAQHGASPCYLGKPRITAAPPSNETIAGNRTIGGSPASMERSVDVLVNGQSGKIKADSGPERWERNMEARSREEEPGKICSLEKRLLPRADGDHPGGARSTVLGIEVRRTQINASVYSDDCRPETRSKPDSLCNSSANNETDVFDRFLEDQPPPPASPPPLSVIVDNAIKLARDNDTTTTTTATTFTIAAAPCNSAKMESKDCEKTSSSRKGSENPGEGQENVGYPDRRSDILYPPSTDVKVRDEKTSPGSGASRKLLWVANSEDAEIDRRPKLRDAHSTIHRLEVGQVESGAGLGERDTTGKEGKKAAGISAGKRQEANGKSCANRNTVDDDDDGGVPESFNDREGGTREKETGDDEDDDRRERVGEEEGPSSSNELYSANDGVATLAEERLGTINKLKDGYIREGRYPMNVIAYYDYDEEDNGREPDALAIIGERQKGLQERLSARAKTARSEKSEYPGASLVKKKNQQEEHERKEAEERQRFRQTGPKQEFIVDLGQPRRENTTLKLASPADDGGRATFAFREKSEGGSVENGKSPEVVLDKTSGCRSSDSPAVDKHRLLERGEFSENNGEESIILAEPVEKIIRIEDGVEEPKVIGVFFDGKNPVRIFERTRQVEASRGLYDDYEGQRREDRYYFRGAGQRSPDHEERIYDELDTINDWKDSEGTGKIRLKGDRRSNQADISHVRAKIQLGNEENDRAQEDRSKLSDRRISADGGGRRGSLGGDENEQASMRERESFKEDSRDIEESETQEISDNASAPNLKRKSKSDYLALKNTDDLFKSGIEQGGDLSGDKTANASLSSANELDEESRSKEIKSASERKALPLSTKDLHESFIEPLDWIDDFDDDNRLTFGRRLKSLEGGSPPKDFSERREKNSSVGPSIAFDGFGKKVENTDEPRVRRQASSYRFFREDGVRDSNDIENSRDTRHTEHDRDSRGFAGLRGEESNFMRNDVPEYDEIQNYREADEIPDQLRPNEPDKQNMKRSDEKQGRKITVLLSTDNWGDESQMNMALHGDLASKIVGEIFDRVQQDEVLKTALGPGLYRRHRPEDAVASDKIYRQGLDEDEVKHTEEIMRRVMVLLDNLVFDRVQKKTCASLPADLQAFLRWLLNADKRQTSNEMSPSPSVPASPPADKYLFPVPDPEGVDVINELYKKVRLLKNLIEEYKALSSKEKTKVQEVHDYLVKQLNLLVKYIEDQERAEAREKSVSRSTGASRAAKGSVSKYKNVLGPSANFNDSQSRIYETFLSSSRVPAVAKINRMDFHGRGDATFDNPFVQRVRRGAVRGLGRSTRQTGGRKRKKKGRMRRRRKKKRKHRKHQKKTGGNQSGKHRIPSRRFAIRPWQYSQPDKNHWDPYESGHERAKIYRSTGMMVRDAPERRTEKSPRSPELHRQDEFTSLYSKRKREIPEINKMTEAVTAEKINVTGELNSDKNFVEAKRHVLGSPVSAPAPWRNAKDKNDFSAQAMKKFSDQLEELKGGARNGDERKVKDLGNLQSSMNEPEKQNPLPIKGKNRLEDEVMLLNKREAWRRENEEKLEEVAFGRDMRRNQKKEEEAFEKLREIDRKRTSGDDDNSRTKREGTEAADPSERRAEPKLSIHDINHVKLNESISENKISLPKAITINASELKSVEPKLSINDIKNDKIKNSTTSGTTTTTTSVSEPVRISKTHLGNVTCKTCNNEDNNGNGAADQPSSEEKFKLLEEKIHVLPSTRANDDDEAVSMCPNKNVSITEKKMKIFLKIDPSIHPPDIGYDYKLGIEPLLDHNCETRIAKPSDPDETHYPIKELIYNNPEETAPAYFDPDILSKSEGGSYDYPDDDTYAPNANTLILI